MIYGLKGFIHEISKDFIVIDVNRVYYEIYVSHPSHFNLNEEIFIYTHQVIREDDMYLIGFKHKAEKDIFLRLITVKGIGPKTAINLLKDTTPENLISAIASSNLSYLKKLPGVGPKAAAQIILDLKGQLTTSKVEVNHQFTEVKDALKNLGFKVGEIDKVLASLNQTVGSSEDIIRLALQKMSK